MEVVYGDGGFDALAYGETHPNVSRFISENTGRLSSLINDAGRGFVDYVGGLVDTVRKSEVSQRVQALASKAGTLWDSDTIRPMTSVHEMQHAKSRMRRWIMAEPMTRELYQQQRVEGYSKLYEDMEPDRIGESHYDYRRVMDGVIVEEGDAWVSTTYFEDLHEDDRDLSLSEQVSISSTWEYLRRQIDRAGFDPTSPGNAPL